MVTFRKKMNKIKVFFCKITTVDKFTLIHC